jgi:hypothetical protein
VRETWLPLRRALLPAVSCHILYNLCYISMRCLQQRTDTSAPVISRVFTAIYPSSPVLQQPHHVGSSPSRRCFRLATDYVSVHTNSCTGISIRTWSHSVRRTAVPLSRCEVPLCPGSGILLTLCPSDPSRSFASYVSTYMAGRTIHL